MVSTVSIIHKSILCWVLFFFFFLEQMTDKEDALEEMRTGQDTGHLVAFPPL